EGVFAEQLRVLDRCERMKIGDEVEGVALLLQLHELSDRAEVVPEVESAGGLDAREDFHAGPETTRGGPRGEKLARVRSLLQETAKKPACSGLGGRIAQAGGPLGAGAGAVRSARARAPAHLVQPELALCLDVMGAELDDRAVVPDRLGLASELLVELGPVPERLDVVVVHF